MKTKHKRLIVISLFVTMGLLLPYIALFWVNTKAVSKVIFYASSYFSLIVARLVYYAIEYKTIKIILIPTFVIAQILIYGGIGYIIARLVYPNKKTLPEFTHSEPDK